MPGNQRYSITEGPPLAVFLYYTVPWLIALIAISSAGVIDGIFIGKLVGVEALAATNIVGPVFSLLFGITLMLSVGGSVRAGKYLGEGATDKARAIFTKTALTVMVFALGMTAAGLLGAHRIARLLGANAAIEPLCAEYIITVIPFAFAFLTSVALSYFVRVSGAPMLASAALILSAATHVALDWLFIAHLGMGIRGAALGTGLSYLAGFTTVLVYFLRPSCPLRPTIRVGSFGEVFVGAFNGLSEFANEISAAVLIFLFNRIMMARMGVPGVAAFTVMNYMLWIGFMFFYGISDGLGPLFSTNLGARRPERVSAFFGIAMICMLAMGVLLAAALALWPSELTGLILRKGDVSAGVIAVRFSRWFWPTFLFAGVNILLSAYFTAMHKPIHSVVAAMSRSFFLPALFLVTLPFLIGDRGVFIALPLGEALASISALAMYLRNRPVAIVAALRP